jgi:hypothetical protein
MDEYRALGEEVCGVVDQFGGAVEVAGREPRAGEVGAERGGGDLDPVEDLVCPREQCGDDRVQARVFASWR